jgi:hypothetical protein
MTTESTNHYQQEIIGATPSGRRGCLKLCSAFRYLKEFGLSAATPEFVFPETQRTHELDHGIAGRRTTERKEVSECNNRSEKKKPIEFENRIGGAATMLAKR